MKRTVPLARYFCVWFDRFCSVKDFTLVKVSDTPRRPYEMLPGTASDSASADSYAWTRPEPNTVAATGDPSSSVTSCVAWFMISALILAGRSPDGARSRSAATPDTCGAAIDVPEIVSESVPVPASDDVMSAPGAATSGFRPLRYRVGPSELKSTIRSS